MNIKDFSSKEARFQAVWSSCGIPLRLAAATFNNYVPACQEKVQALNKCQTFAEQGMDIILKGQGLFLQGPVGTGKSHLAVATLRDLIENKTILFGKRSSVNGFIDEPVYDGFYCSMVSVVDLLNTLRESFNTDQFKPTARDMLHRVRSDALVILDDIGAEKPSDWVEEQLYAIIDQRYRMKRSTFFTTNCTLRQLELQIGSRSVSRIMEMCQGVKVGGEDWRKRLI